MSADWGVDDAPWRDDWPREPLPPSDLPSVVAARAAGWHLLPEVPAWAFLPSVWPRAARAWVPDRSVRLVRMEWDGVVGPAIPWSAWDHLQMEELVTTLLAEAGLPPRPFGRLWLLRPPPGVPDLDATVGALRDVAERAGVPIGCSAPLVELVDRTLASWFGTDA